MKTEKIVTLVLNKLTEYITNIVIEELRVHNSSDRWITLKNGRHILIGKDETIEEALDRLYSQEIKGNKKRYDEILKSVENDNKKEITPEDIIEDIATDPKLKLNYSIEDLNKKIQAAEKYNDKVITTEEKYKNPKTGKYTEEREKKHKEIINEIFKDEKKAKPQNGKKPIFIMLGGRGGSGKSKFNGLVYDKSNFIVLDADAIKEKLPEYKGFNAWEVHEESSDILNKALKIAKRKKLNVVIDGTLKTKISSEQKIKRMKASGYNIEMYYMHLPRVEAAKRAMSRFMGKIGRYVPLKTLLSMKDNEKNFDELKKYASKWAFYDNSKSEPNEPPELIIKNY